MTSITHFFKNSAYKAVSQQFIYTFGVRLCAFVFQQETAHKMR